jgi:hypothetical protein
MSRGGNICITLARLRKCKSFDMDLCDAPTHRTRQTIALAADLAVTLALALALALVVSLVVALVVALILSIIGIDFSLVLLFAFPFPFTFTFTFGASLGS